MDTSSPTPKPISYRKFSIVYLVFSSILGLGSFFIGGCIIALAIFVVFGIGALKIFDSPLLPYVALGWVLVVWWVTAKKMFARYRIDHPERVPIYATLINIALTVFTFVLQVMWHPDTLSVLDTSSELLAKVSFVLLVYVLLKKLADRASSPVASSAG